MPKTSIVDSSRTVCNNGECVQITKSCVNGDCTERRIIVDGNMLSNNLEGKRTSGMPQSLLEGICDKSIALGIERGKSGQRRASYHLTDGLCIRRDRKCHRNLTALPFIRSG